MIGAVLSDKEPRTLLDTRCARAKVAVIKAQLAYAELAARDESDEREVDLAWLELWRAEERERALVKALDSLDA